MKQVRRKEGATWVLRYRTNKTDGRRVENTLPVGLLRDFPRERDAWREVDRLSLIVRINQEEVPARLQFAALAEHYLMADFGEDAVRPKAEKTISNTQHIVRHYLIGHFGNQIADDIKPLDIQRWLKLLHGEQGLAWTAVSKIRGVMG